MKILQIIASLSDGGAEKFVIDLSNELSKKHDVVICTLFDIDNDMFLAKTLSSRVKVISLSKKKGLDLKIFYKIYKLIEQIKPDVVNTHVRALFYTTFPILFFKSKFVHTVHNMADKETSYIYRLIYKIFFNYFKVTPIAISKKVLESIQLEYSNSFKILIENGVKQLHPTSQVDKVKQEIEKYKVTENTKVLLTIGRIGSQKNYVLLVKTVNQLIQDNFDIVLLIIGRDYGDLEMLKSIASKHIYFLGQKINVVDYINNADAFCLSSLYEGLPIVLLESLSMGCIPICTPAGGIVDVIDKDIGFMCDGFSESSYYKIMREFLETDISNLNKMKHNCQKLFNINYNIEKTAEKYLYLYNTL